LPPNYLQFQSEKSFIITGFDGGNTGNAYAWLVNNPTQTYEETDVKCKAFSESAPSISTGIQVKTTFGKTSTTQYCPISPNTNYYLNLRTDLNVNLSVKVFEESSDMLR